MWPFTLSSYPSSTLLSPCQAFSLANFRIPLSLYSTQPVFSAVLLDTHPTPAKVSCSICIYPAAGPALRVTLVNTK